MKVIDNELLLEVSSKARVSVRKRQNYNFHESLDAEVQRMLNAMEPGTYVQPHKHQDPDKIEAFILLRGRALVVEFDDDGEITSHCVLSAQRMVCMEQKFSLAPGILLSRWSRVLWFMKQRKVLILRLMIKILLPGRPKSLILNVASMSAICCFAVELNSERVG